MCIAHAKLELEPRMCVSLDVNQRENVTCEVCCSQDEILEVLVFEVSAGVLGARGHMSCFTTPRREGLNSTLQRLNSSRGLSLCAECVESANQKVPFETTGVSPPCCPVT